VTFQEIIERAVNQIAVDSELTEEIVTRAVQETLQLVATDLSQSTAIETIDEVVDFLRALAAELEP
jgi:hypothetical protein